MKNKLIVLLLLIAVCVTGCTTGSEESVATTTADQTTQNPPHSDAPVDPTDPWAGVDGDSVELQFTVSDQIFAGLKKDGTASMYYMAEPYITAKDFGFEEYDAEMGAYVYYYGTHKTENGNIVISVNNTMYLRYDVRGKDAQAFQNAYASYIKSENPNQADLVDKVFETGYPRWGEDKDSNIYVCTYTDGKLMPLNMKNIDENGVLLTETVYDDDGSYVTTNYTEDGAVDSVCEYTKEGELARQTKYNKDGKVEYVQTTLTNSKGVKVTTRVDGEGKEFYRHEQSKTQVSTGEKTVNKIFENGVQTSYEEIETRKNGLRVIYTITQEGDQKIERKDVDGGIGGNEYSMEKRTKNGVLTFYRCHRYLDKDGVHYFSVEYNAATDVYEELIRYTDGSEENREVPGDEYVRVDWEIYE